MDKDEWFKQANYDMETAEYMFKGERYFYAVFMCHLSIEKALKGLIIQKNKEAPPKTHNLLYLIEIIYLELPEDMFVFTLNRVSVLTRYPDNLQRMLTEYTEDTTEQIIENGKELLKWLKTK